MSLYLTILMCVGLWCVMWCEGSRALARAQTLALGSMSSPPDRLSTAVLKHLLAFLDATCSNTFVRGYCGGDAFLA